MRDLLNKVALIFLVLAISFSVVDGLITNHSTRKVNEKMKELHQRQLELLEEQELINRQIQDLYLHLFDRRE